MKKQKLRKIKTTKKFKRQNNKLRKLQMKQTKIQKYKMKNKNQKMIFPNLSKIKINNFSKFILKLL